MRCNETTIDHSLILLKDTIKLLKKIKKESNFYDWWPMIECNLININNLLEVNKEK